MVSPRGLRSMLWPFAATLALGCAEAETDDEGGGGASDGGSDQGGAALGGGGAGGDGGDGGAGGAPPMPSCEPVEEGLVGEDCGLFVDPSASLGGRWQPADAVPHDRGGHRGRQLLERPDLRLCQRAPGERHPRPRSHALRWHHLRRRLELEPGRQDAPDRRPWHCPADDLRRRFGGVGDDGLGLRCRGARRCAGQRILHRGDRRWRLRGVRARLARRRERRRGEPEFRGTKPGGRVRAVRRERRRHRRRRPPVAAARAGLSVETAARRSRASTRAATRASPTRTTAARRSATSARPCAKTAGRARTERTAWMASTPRASARSTCSASPPASGTPGTDGQHAGGGGGGGSVFNSAGGGGGRRRLRWDWRRSWARWRVVDRPHRARREPGAQRHHLRRGLWR
jgi:hypothetical protein